MYNLRQFWFAAHLHAKFSAIYKDKTKGKESFFLALDKCLPKRDFLQILSLKRGEKGLIEIVSLNEKQEIPLKNEPIELFYDVEWLGILTHAEELYESLKKKGVVFTFSRENPYSFDNLGFQKNNEIINNFNKIFDKTKEKLQKTDLKIVEKSSFSERNDIPGINLALNPQTMEILNKLCIEKERYRGYLYYQGEEMKKEIKLMENNEEINLDLDEEFEHLEEKKE